MWRTQYPIVIKADRGDHHDMRQARCTRARCGRDNRRGTRSGGGSSSAIPPRAAFPIGHFRPLSARIKRLPWRLLSFRGRRAAASPKPGEHRPLEYGVRASPCGRSRNDDSGTARSPRSRSHPPFRGGMRALWTRCTCGRKSPHPRPLSPRGESRFPSPRGRGVRGEGTAAASASRNRLDLAVEGHQQ